MKATVRTPKGKKNWIVFLMGAFTVLLGIWPLAVSFNKPLVVLGIPLIAFNSYLVAACVVVTLYCANKWEVF
jgi:hypothetical protein